MERAAAIFLLLVPYIVTIAGCQSPQQTAAMGALLSGNAVYASDPQRAAALATLGNSATGFANAQASAPQVNVNTVNKGNAANNANPIKPTVPAQSIWYATDHKMTDGGTYTGPLKPMSDGLSYPHGHGVSIWPDGRKYVGGWKDGKSSGHGILTFGNGERYEGEFKDGKCDGHGVYTFPDGSRYEGVWKDGLPNGRGVDIRPDGTRHEGNWVNSKMNGQVVITTPYGTRQDAEYREGKRVKSKGVDVWPDGTRYEGEWNFEGGKSGGKILWKDGHEYTGGWKIVEGGQDLPDGEGTMKWPDGRNYTGDFRDGKIHGFGKMVYADGRTEEGAWRDDKFVGSQSQVNVSDNQKGQGSSSRFGVVNITADDLTFEVFADGAFVGNSPAKLKLSEGPHTIEVRKNGFKDYKKEIRVADGSELNIRAVLEKL